MSALTISFELNHKIETLALIASNGPLALINILINT